MRNGEAPFESMRGETWDGATNPAAADVIVSLRVADLRNPIYGSIERDCALCEEPVLISPPTFAVFRGRALPPIWCAQCALDAVLALPGGD